MFSFVIFKPHICFHSFHFSETFTFKSEFAHGDCALEGFENVVEKLSSAFEPCHLLARVVIQKSTRNGNILKEDNKG